MSALSEGEPCENEGLGVGSGTLRPRDLSRLTGLSLERESSASGSSSESA